jgi:hypothetical protein
MLRRFSAAVATSREGHRTQDQAGQASTEVSTPPRVATPAGSFLCSVFLLPQKFGALVNHVTSGRQKICGYIGKLTRRRWGMQMLAWIIAVVVAIGLIWSVAAMSNLVPVVEGSGSAAISQPAE